MVGNKQVASEKRAESRFRRAFTLALPARRVTAFWPRGYLLKGLLENRGGRHCQPQRPRRSKSAPEHFRTTLGWYHAPRHVFVLQNSQ